MPFPYNNVYPYSNVYPSSAAYPFSDTAVVATPKWRFVICDMAGNAIGEPRATQRTFNAGISKTSTASFRLRSDDQLWGAVTADTTMLKVYDSGQVLRYYGRTVSGEEVGDGSGATVQVQSADLTWRLGKRYWGKDLANGVGAEYINVDSGQIVFEMLAGLNTQTVSTGIQPGVRQVFVPRTVTYLWKRALDVLSELGSISSSYEWQLRYSDGAPPSVYLDLLLQVGNDVTTQVFLEYGTGLKNCMGYSRTKTSDTQATRVYALGAGSSFSVEAYDTGSEGYERLEDVLSLGDIATPSLLDALAAYHVAVRKHPREMIKLTPFPKTSPRYGTNFVVGDYATARVKVDDSVRVNGVVRIWDAAITITDAGDEQAQLTMEPQ